MVSVAILAFGWLVVLHKNLNKYCGKVLVRWLDWDLPPNQDQGLLREHLPPKNVFFGVFRLLALMVIITFYDSTHDNENEMRIIKVWQLHLEQHHPDLLIPIRAPKVLITAITPTPFQSACIFYDFLLYHRTNCNFDDVDVDPFCGWQQDFRSFKIPCFYFFSKSARPT